MDFSKLNLNDNQELARLIIKSASLEEFKSRSSFEKFRNSFVKKYKGVIFHNLYFIKAYRDLLKSGEISDNPRLLSYIQKRGVRTLSGVAPVTVLMKPYPCPGRCVYCPNDVRMPKSYLPSQPAAQRAFRQNFNPYTQVFVRLRALQITGHEISKVELRIIGGTFGAYPKFYRTWFIKRCLQAMNEFNLKITSGDYEDMADFTRKKFLKSVYGIDEINSVVVRSLGGARLRFCSVLKSNESSDVRCIGINVETRPDHVNKSEILYLRSLSVTKVELGVQTVDDNVQKITQRGHDSLAVKEATALLKDAGFKVGYHMMPNLPGADVAGDRTMISALFESSDYQPDYLKIYPCVVLPKSRLAIYFRKGLYKSYSDDVLAEILLEHLKSVPVWCRIDRIARDIPSNEIESGFKSSNIRQLLENQLIKEGTPCRDIRAREIKNDTFDEGSVELLVRKYCASGGLEYFLSYEDVKNDKLLALLRLRVLKKPFISALVGATIVREIHVYGRQISLGKHVQGNVQHFGWGTRLLNEAEKFSRKLKFKKIAVISGIGVREFYTKRGYRLEGTYMVKDV